MMIQGIVDLRVKDRSKILASLFYPSNMYLQQKNLSHGTLGNNNNNTQHDEKIYWHYSEKNKFSVTFGSCHAKALLLVHGNCQGISCPCLTHAQEIFQMSMCEDDSEYDYRVMDAVRLRAIAAPATLIFIEDELRIQAMKYGEHEDSDVRGLSESIYILEDYFLRMVREDEAPLYEAALNSHSDHSLADGIEVSLKPSYSSYPSSPCQSLVLLHSPQETSIQSKSHAKVTTPDNQSKMKKPPTAFNIFFQENRPKYSAMYPEMEKNCLNVLVSEEWKKMAVEEQRPYYQRQAEEKLRHQMACANLPKVESTLSDYNIFLQQEKEVVKKFHLDDRKSDFAKCTKLRWKDMAAEEKELYQVLQVVEKEKAGTAMETEK